MSEYSYLERSLYPPGMEVKVGTVPTPPGLPATVQKGTVPTPPGLPVPFKKGTVPGPFGTSKKTGKPDAHPEMTSLIFDVHIDDHIDLGGWIKVDGLSVKFEIGEYRAGDGNNHRWIEPAYTTYSNVKLGRATTLKYTTEIMKWLQDTSFNSKKSTAVIIGYPFWHNKKDESLSVKWHLKGVLPVAWSGPQFDNQSGKVAIETLELAHEGFLDADT
jgi:phage tail-like protein